MNHAHYSPEHYSLSRRELVLLAALQPLESSPKSDYTRVVFLDKLFNVKVVCSMELFELTTINLN